MLCLCLLSKHCHSSIKSACACVLAQNPDGKLFVPQSSALLDTGTKPNQSESESSVSNSADNNHMISKTSACQIYDPSSEREQKFVRSLVRLDQVVCTFGCKGMMLNEGFMEIVFAC